MTREEEIREAIKTLQVYVCGDNGIFECSECIDSDIQNAFYQGVKWADKHPKSPWISVKDDLPCNHVELLEDCFQTKYVEACFTHSDGSSFVTIVKMVRVDVGIGKDCWTWSSNLREHVTYWKPISEPPKEQEINYDKRRLHIF